MQILDLTKLLMQDFNYNYIKGKYGDKDEKLFTGTDILMCKTETEVVYEELYTNKDLFDFSNYPKDSR